MPRGGFCSPDGVIDGYVVAGGDSGGGGVVGGVLHISFLTYFKLPDPPGRVVCPTVLVFRSPHRSDTFTHQVFKLYYRKYNRSYKVIDHS